MNNNFSLGRLSDIPDSSFAPIPAGRYHVRPVRIELKATQAGTGHFLKVEFDVISTQYAGRKIFENFNIDNPNPEAARIGCARVKNWALAAGVSPETTVNGPVIFGLEGRAVEAAIIIKPDASGRYSDSNGITEFFALPESQQTHPFRQTPVHQGQQDFAGEQQYQQQPVQQHVQSPPMAQGQGQSSFQGQGSQVLSQQQDTPPWG